MIIGRALGWALVIIALLIVGAGIGIWLVAGPTTGGELWFRLDHESLNLVQAITQRYISPWLWDPVIVDILLWPAGLAVMPLAVIPALIGIALVALFRRRRRGWV
jgi:hypothetical protein